MNGFSGIAFKMEESIKAKLIEIGATSKTRAVAIQDTNLDTQELNWLDYIAGGLFAQVKKTNDRRYYVSS
ncbi:hypothetical protein E2P47_03670 [Candidatus Bathyarchaeota archaeon]|nr:MAG: hypothetical protein AC479_04390 [miscellaneous Crenarchaeota group-6 archaeon AD8-1]TRO47930.1 hypothetical protein E2P47_03670 [Candidatus Bathyarchaeota archaeon]